MSSKSGLPTIVVKVTIPASGTNVAFTHGAAAITTLSAGKWLVSYNSAFLPITNAATLNGSNIVLSTVAPYLTGGYNVQIGHVGSFLPGGANLIERDCLSGIISLSVTSPIYLYVLLQTSAGNWSTVISGVAPDVNGNVITFVKIE